MAPGTQGSREGPQGSREGPQGGPRGAQSAISTPLWEISTPHWTSHIPHVCPGGVLPTMRQGLYRMAWSSNPMEASPLVLRSVTVLPRALLEVSADPPVRRRRQHNNNNNNNPACINSPLQTSPPGWFVNPFGQPLTLTCICKSWTIVVVAPEGRKQICVQEQI